MESLDTTSSVEHIFRANIQNQRKAIRFRSLPSSVNDGYSCVTRSHPTRLSTLEVRI